MALTRRRRIALILAGVALAGVVGRWFMVGAAFDGYRIPVESMEPTLHRGDRVLARSIDGRDASVADVIIFTAPGLDLRSGIERISRVVAVEGDDVAVDHGYLVVNGDRMSEPYLREGTETTDLASATVPSGSVYVLSDNGSNAQDSRVFGPVPRENIYVRVSFRWWPLGDVARI